MKLLHSQTQRVTKQRAVVGSDRVMPRECRSATGLTAGRHTMRERP